MLHVTFPFFVLERRKEMLDVVKQIINEKPQLPNISVERVFRIFTRYMHRDITLDVVGCIISELHDDGINCVFYMSMEKNQPKAKLSWQDEKGEYTRSIDLS